VAHNPDEGENAKTPSVIELYDTTKKQEEPYRCEDNSGKTVAEGVYVYFLSGRIPRSLPRNFVRKAIGYETRNTINFFEEKYPVACRGVFYYKRIKTIPFDGVDKTREEDQDPSFTPICNEVYGNLYYDGKLDVFIGMGKQKGLYISDSDGKVILTDAQYADHRYSPEFHMFYRFSAADGGYKADVMDLDTILAGK
jgi:hypothetical protein